MSSRKAKRKISFFPWFRFRDAKRPIVSIICSWASFLLFFFFFIFFSCFLSSLLRVHKLFNINLCPCGAASLLMNLIKMKPLHRSHVREISRDAERFSLSHFVFVFIFFFSCSSDILNVYYYGWSIDASIKKFKKTDYISWCWISETFNEIPLRNVDKKHKMPRMSRHTA